MFALGTIKEMGSSVQKKHYKEVSLLSRCLLWERKGLLFSTDVLILCYLYYTVMLEPFKYILSI